VVEGQSSCCFGQDPPKNSVQVTEHVNSRHPKRFYARFAQPPVARQIMLGLNSAGMSLSIHFDG
jgi:hypothetical protein